MSDPRGGIADLLYAASDHPAPSRIDLGLAVRDGRRRRRRRRVLGPVVAALAVLALAGGIAAVRPSSPPQPVAVPPPAVRFDPLVSTLSVAYPEVEVFRHYFVVDARTQTLMLAHLPDGSPASVTLYGDATLPWDDQPPASVWQAGPSGPSQVRLGSQPAPAVHGREARWVLLYDRVVGLAWQWEPGRWGVVYPLVHWKEDVRSTAQDMVAAVHTDATEPLRFPLEVPVPAGWRHVATEVGNLNIGFGFNRSGQPLPGPPDDLMSQADLSVVVVPMDVRGDATRSRLPRFSGGSAPSSGAHPGSTQ